MEVNRINVTSVNKEFMLEEFLDSNIIKELPVKASNSDDFEEICKIVSFEFDKDWENTEDKVKNLKLEREKKAIMGYPAETKYYKEKIKEILRGKKLLNSVFPSWYENIWEAVFAELYGLSGLAPWAYDTTEEYKNSSSAKLIGENLYCLIDGKSQLQQQKIPKKRREQLKRALLLATPHERLEYGFHEVYLHNGIRITIYSGERTKNDQDVMVFRKYLIKKFSFEQFVKVGTIPFEAIELFRSMIAIGYNVIFAGQVRSGKTTFLQTWQSYEDKYLEGLAIATDDETQWNEIMPDVPIMQLIADGDNLDTIVKSLMRGDNDYIIVEEMRDATAYNLALEIASTGTQRCKGTIHDNDGINIPYKMATKIHAKYGGNLNSTIAQIFKKINYVFEFAQLNDDKSKKVLTGIVEYLYDYDENRVYVRRICKYDIADNKWMWKYYFGKDKEDIGKHSLEEIENFKKTLRWLESKNPLLAQTVIEPAYYNRKI